MSLDLGGTSDSAVGHIPPHHGASLKPKVSQWTKNVSIWRVFGRIGRQVVQSFPGLETWPVLQTSRSLRVRSKLGTCLGGIIRIWVVNRSYHGRSLSGFISGFTFLKPRSSPTMPPG